MALSIDREGKHQSWLKRAFNLETRAMAIERIQPHTVVMCGISGQSIGWPVAAQLNLPTAVVRKATESRNSSFEVEATEFVTTYVIVDDFISSGRSIHYIKEVMARNFPGSTCMGIILYDCAENAHNGADFKVTDEVWYVPASVYQKYGVAS